MAVYNKALFRYLLAVVAALSLIAVIYQTAPNIFRVVKYQHCHNSNTTTRNGILFLAIGDLRQLEGAFPAVWVNKTGELHERLQAMEESISRLRDRMLVQYKDKPWSRSSGPMCVVDGKMEVRHLETISTSGAVIPVFLPWIPQGGVSEAYPLNTLSDTSNLVIQRYFPWISDPVLCGWIKSNITNMRYHVVFNGKCTTNPMVALRATSMDLVTLNARPAEVVFPTFPSFYYTDLPKHVVYLLLAHNAFFTHIGDLIASNVKYVPNTCGYETAPAYPDGIENLPVYDEILSISQYWGSGLYHKNIENFPRLASFLPWLRKNQQIKIHVFENGNFTIKLLGYLGISSDRLVTGPVKAKIGYMPESTSCGFGHVVNSQLLSKEYRNIIHKTFKQTERSSIVLIRRSGLRRLTSHDQVEAMLRKQSGLHNLRFELFIDNPPPPLEETMRMFNRAVMVVAPHGAGLWNIMFAEPETFIIEGVCNRPHVNLCYQRQAYILGQHYHAIPSKRGCEEVIDIDVASFENVTQFYIPHAIKLVQR